MIFLYSSYLFFVFFFKTPTYPGFSLTSSEQSLRVLWEDVSRLKSLVVVQSQSPIWLFATPRTTALQASLSFIISQSLRKLMPIESVMPSNHLMLCHPFLLLPSIFPSMPTKWNLILNLWVVLFFFQLMMHSNEKSGVFLFHRLFCVFLIESQGNVLQLGRWRLTPDFRLQSEPSLFTYLFKLPFRKQSLWCYFATLWLHSSSLIILWVILMPFYNPCLES